MLRSAFTTVAAAALLMLGYGVVLGETSKSLYDHSCAQCHGLTGKGDGAAARALRVPPGDFATAPKARDEGTVVQVITEGKTHPSFARKLSEDQIKAVAQYVKQLSAQ